jgi:predicted RND superfamily exporter protein
VRRLLDGLAVPATRAPWVTLAALVLLTVVLAGTATQLVVSSDLSDFAPEGGLNASLEDIERRFGAGESIQLIVDTGEGGDLLDPGGLAAGEGLADALRTDPELAGLLAEGGLDRPSVLTYTEPFAVATDLLGISLEDLDAASTEALVRTLLEGEVGAQAASLLSDDLRVDPPRARGGIGLVELRPGLDDDQQLVATAAVERIAAAAQVPGVRVSVLSDVVIESAVQDGIERDIPILLSLSLGLVVLVLAWLFRSVSDVVVGLSGLIASIVWMAGFAALLGPSMLDLVGPFGQTAIAVPVLLVGLGVDYSVHLTTRYREQQARGDTPEEAARTAVHTVGVALALATAATVGGFLANLATPLPPIADLGIFAALGIVSAFVLFGLGVPATRVVLDRRRTSDGGARGPSAGPSRWTDGLTALAVGRPAAVLVVTGLLLVVAGAGAAGLGTEFNERSFLPDGAPVAATIERTDVLFGGDVGEQTYVLIDGDRDDPELLAAAAELEDGLVRLDAVRRQGDRPQVTSPFELIDRLGERGQRVRDQLASDLEAWADPAAAGRDLPIPEQLSPETIEANVEADQDLDVPPAVLEAIARRLPAGRPPAVALATSGDPAVVREAVREQLRDEVLAERPPDLSDAAVARLADLPPAGLDVATLEAAGFPLGTLADVDRTALRRLDRLERAGWDDQDPSRDPADVAEQLAVAADEVPDELAQVSDDDGLLLVVSTTAGRAGAGELATRIAELGTGAESAGGTVTIVSGPLVNEEIIDALSAAQLLAIVISIAIAAALLVLASLLSDRSVALGLIGIAPAGVALVLVLGTMRAIGLSFNALTATVASIAIGIGVPYGIHLTNRFRDSLVTEPGIEEAIGDTLRHTGGALAGSAVTTGLAFGVLGLSTSVPLRQFGIVSALMITYALLACLLLQPTLLALWARRRVGTDRAAGERASDGPLVSLSGR